MARTEKPAAKHLEPARLRGQGHADIVATLGSEILSGIRAPGSRLPSAEEMFVTFGVSRMVLREVTRTLAAKGRHDPCVLPRAVVIVEAMAALTLADLFLEQRARVDLF